MKGVFAFYSYKGGTGRTTASANVSAMLARRGYRVLCLDLDLEGPGLGIVFNLIEGGDSFQLQNYFEGKHELTSNDFVSQKALAGKGELFVLPASNRLVGTVDTSKGGKLLSHLTRLVKQANEEIGIDVVIIDTPSGFGDLSALSMYIAECVVALFRFSRQHLFGTARISDFVRKNNLDFIAAASCVPASGSLEKEKYLGMVRSFYDSPLIEIAEDDGLKWRERVLGMDESNSPAFAGYDAVAEELSHRIKGT